MDENVTHQAPAPTAAPDASAGAAMAAGAPPVLHVAGLTKIYRPRSTSPVTALEDVSFSVQQGQVVGLLGPNGAGKTTAIKAICGLVTPTSGSVHVCGVDVATRRLAALRNIAAVFEGSRQIFWRLTVRENLHLAAGLHGIDRRLARVKAEELLSMFALGRKRDTPARMLSKGMQQRLALACALIRSTPIVLLDEPTLGLDVESDLEFRSLLAGLRGERTVLLSTHDMSLVERVCQRAVIISRGRLVADDSVDGLLGLFRTSSYRIAVRGSGADDLAALFPSARVLVERERSEMRFDFPDPRRVYEVLDQLQRSGYELLSVDRCEPDLEMVFLRLVAPIGGEPGTELM